MKLASGADIRTVLENLDSDSIRADYVYMYPPRQAYRRFSESESNNLASWISASLARFDELNMYIHVPFCKQICGFCNLYTTIGGKGDETSEYLASLKREAHLYAEVVGRKTLQTIYIGGGTPSLLKPEDLESILDLVTRLFQRPGTTFPREIALEVAPETVDRQRLRSIREAGINRINMGYQSMFSAEVTQFGRRRAGLEYRGLLEDALDSEFDNVCVDLIYGLRFQTDASWEASVRQVAEIAPQTICAYALTSRPHTSYQKAGFFGAEAATLYRRYEVADQILREAGYTQQTHVRWVRAGGGYLQKQYHWGMQNLLGLGAGARSYLWEVDIRNGYSMKTRTNALLEYNSHMAENDLAISDGYAMSAGERERKAVVLGLISLNRRWFTDQFGSDPLTLFGEEFRALEEYGLCSVSVDHVRLTERGRKYRDVLSQLFFSDRVRSRLSQFNYQE